MAQLKKIMNNDTVVNDPMNAPVLRRNPSRICRDRPVLTEQQRHSILHGESDSSDDEDLNYSDNRSDFSSDSSSGSDMDTDVTDDTSSSEG